MRRAPSGDSAGPTKNCVSVEKSRAVTSGERYRREGYLTRSLRNLGCILLYYLRVPPRVLARLYG